MAAPDVGKPREEQKPLACARQRGIFPSPRGHSLMVKFQPSKLAMRVRFPLPAERKLDISTTGRFTRHPFYAKSSL